MSIDEVRLAAKLGDSTVDLLREFGVFEGMQESNQISLFGQKYPLTIKKTIVSGYFQARFAERKLEKSP